MYFLFSVRNMLKKLSGFGLNIFMTTPVSFPVCIKTWESATQACIILYSPVWFPSINGWPGESTKPSVPKGLSGLRSTIGRHRKRRMEGYSHRPLENNYTLKDCKAASNLMERRTKWILIGPTCSTPPAWRASSTWTHQRAISRRKPTKTHLKCTRRFNVALKYTILLRP